MHKSAVCLLVGRGGGGRSKGRNNIMQIIFLFCEFYTEHNRIHKNKTTVSFLARQSFHTRALLTGVCNQGPVSWRQTTVKWRQSSQSNRHSTIGTRQTQFPQALPSSTNVQSHLTSSFTGDDNASWYSVCRLPMVEWRLDCENCRHLTVVGFHDTGPRSSQALEIISAFKDGSRCCNERVGGAGQSVRNLGTSCFCCVAAKRSFERHCRPLNAEEGHDLMVKWNCRKEKKCTSGSEQRRGARGIGCITNYMGAASCGYDV